MSDRSLKGWPNQSQQKEVQSQKDTRNPTTNKKIHGTPVQFKRSEYYLQPRVNPRFYQHHSRQQFPSIEGEMYQYLMDEKNRYMNNGKYKKASKIQEKIKRAQSARVSRDISQKKEYYRIEKKQLTMAFKRQVQNLHRQWSQFRDRFRQRKIEFIQYYKVQDMIEINQARTKLERKCKSLRSHSKQIIDLKNKQEYFRKKGDFKELLRIKKQLKLAKERQSQLKQKKIQNWTIQQQRKLSLNKSKKYNALMSRMEQFQHDRDRMYARQQRRLKQKYKNVLAQLQHEKTMDFCNTQMLLSFDN